MAKINILKFRVTSTQRQHIEELAQEQGYVSLSSYLRETVLKTPYQDAEVREMFKKIMEKLS